MKSAETVSISYEGTAYHMPSPAEKGDHRKAMVNEENKLR